MVVYQLRPRDFIFKQLNPYDPNAPADMMIGIPGYVFVMFYANDCKICVHSAPNFIAVAEALPRIECARSDVAANGKEIARNSLRSKTPITKTPIIALYKDGVYQIAYNGPLTKEDMFNNFLRMYHYISAKKTPDEGKTCSLKNGMNAYCAVGYDEEDDGCFVSFDEVFNNTPVTKKSTVVTVGEAFGMN